MQCACTSTVLIRLPAMTTSQRRCAWAWTPPPEPEPAPAEISQSTKATAVPSVGASVLIDIRISFRWVDLAFGASLLWLDRCVVPQNLFLNDGARARFAGGIRPINREFQHRRLPHGRHADFRTLCRDPLRSDDAGAAGRLPLADRDARAAARPEQDLRAQSEARQGDGAARHPLPHRLLAERA